MEASFPVGPRAALSTGLLERLETLYGIGPITRYRDLGGAYNLNAHVETPRGAYVARVYRPWVTAQRLQALHTLKHWLAGQHIPVVLPIPTVAGASVGTYGDRIVDVEPFLPQSDVPESSSGYARAFALLGRFHTVLARYTSVPDLPTPLVENWGIPAVLMTWVEQTKHRIQQVMHPETPAATALCDQTLELLGHLSRWWAEAGHRLPQQLVHGDYGVGNLLWQEHAIVAIGDFDFVAVHERLWDIAYALYWMCARLEPTTEPRAWAWEHVVAMLAHYTLHSHHPLGVDERRAIPLEMARVPLYWIAEAGFLADPVGAVLRAAPGVRVARWLIEHADVIDLG